MPCNKDRLMRGAKIEHREHPWTSMAQATKIASDHLKEHPRMYPAKKRR